MSKKDTPQEPSKALTAKEVSGGGTAAIDYVNAGGAVVAGLIALVNPIAAVAIGGVTAFGGLLGVRGAKKQVDAVAASVEYLARRLDEARAVLGDKLERDDVVEVVHEALKDTLATSYATNRKRIADVVVNGLVGDADARSLRMFEKAAAALDDTAIEVLTNLALNYDGPLWGDVDAPRRDAFFAERRRVLESPFGPGALFELVRFGLARAEEILDFEPDRDADGKLTRDIGYTGRNPPEISESGRRFLAWVRDPSAL